MNLAQVFALLLGGLALVSYRRPGLALTLFVVAAVVWLLARRKHR